ncbi:hypothetical protein TNCV_1960421 [Trichonephila clavipes]|nr:hypothetical protein TNCV_1960421 [Trichonephila clavipes]
MACSENSFRSHMRLGLDEQQIRFSGGLRLDAERSTDHASDRQRDYSLGNVFFFSSFPSSTVRTILDRVLGARAAGVHYRLFSVWTLVPVRLDQQLSDHSTVDEIASGAADCRLTYTMANCPQRRKGEKERENEKKKSSEKTRAGRFRKRRGESQSFLLGDADQESEARMSKNALRTGRRQAVE